MDLQHSIACSGVVIAKQSDPSAAKTIATNINAMRAFDVINVEPCLCRLTRETVSN
jgi:hypothetical protein